jgi:hypothetical protein
MSGESFYYALVESFPDMAARAVFMSGLLERAHFLLALPHVCLEKPFNADALREAIRINCARPCAACVVDCGGRGALASYARIPFPFTPSLATLSLSSSDLSGSCHPRA